MTRCADLMEGQWKVAGKNTLDMCRSECRRRHCKAHPETCDTSQAGLPKVEGELMSRGRITEGVLVLYRRYRHFTSRKPSTLNDAQAPTNTFFLICLPEAQRRSPPLIRRLKSHLNTYPVDTGQASNFPNAKQRNDYLNQTSKSTDSTYEVRLR